MKTDMIYVPTVGGGGGGGNPIDVPTRGDGYLGSVETRRRVRIPSPGVGSNDPIYTVLSGAEFESSIIIGDRSGAQGLLAQIVDDGVKRWFEFYAGTRNGISFIGGEEINIIPKGLTIPVPTTAIIYSPVEEIVVP